MFVCYGHNTYVPSTAIRNSVNFPLEPFFWSAFLPFILLTTLARVQNLQMCLWLCMGSATLNAAFTRIATCRNNRYAFHEGADILFFFFCFCLSFFYHCYRGQRGQRGNAQSGSGTIWKNYCENRNCDIYFCFTHRRRQVNTFATHTPHWSSGLARQLSIRNVNDLRTCVAAGRLSKPNEYILYIFQPFRPVACLPLVE